MTDIPFLAGLYLVWRSWTGLSRSIGCREIGILQVSNFLMLLFENFLYEISRVIQLQDVMKCKESKPDDPMREMREKSKTKLIRIPFLISIDINLESWILFLDTIDFDVIQHCHQSFFHE